MRLLRLVVDLLKADYDRTLESKKTVANSFHNSSRACFNGCAKLCAFDLCVYVRQLILEEKTIRTIERDVIGINRERGRIVYVALSSCGVQSVKRLARLQGLDRLQLSHCTISPDVATAVIQIPSLSELMLFDCVVEPGSLDTICEQTGIKVLDLTGSSLPQNASNVLSKAGHLRCLYLPEGATDYGEIISLKASLPNTNVDTQ